MVQVPALPPMVVPQQEPEGQTVPAAPATPPTDVQTEAGRMTQPPAFGRAQEPGWVLERRWRRRCQRYFRNLGKDEVTARQQQCIPDLPRLPVHRRYTNQTEQQRQFGLLIQFEPLLVHLTIHMNGQVWQAQ